MVKGLALTVLAENTASMEFPSLWAQHGLSFLLEIDLGNSDKMRVLMDTGPSPETLLHNVDVLGVDLTRVDTIFISHGHYDHTGGLLGVLKRVGKKVPVITYPTAFQPKLKVEPYLKTIGPACTPYEVEAAGGVILSAKNAVQLAEGVLTSGQVERSTTFKKNQAFYTISGDQFVQDDMLDDQALIVYVAGKGLAVFSGCAHSGIINILRHSQKISGVNDIYAVVGGFHLDKAKEELIRSTTEELQKLKPKLVAPCHCTGLRAVIHLVKLFGDRCRPLRVGDTLKL